MARSEVWSVALTFDVCLMWWERGICFWLFVVCCLDVCQWVSDDVNIRSLILNSNKTATSSHESWCAGEMLAGVVLVQKSNQDVGWKTLRNFVVVVIKLDCYLLATYLLSICLYSNQACLFQHPWNIIGACPIHSLIKDIGRKYT